MTSLRDQVVAPLEKYLASLSRPEASETPVNAPVSDETPVDEDLAFDLDIIAEDYRNGG